MVVSAGASSTHGLPLIATTDLTRVVDNTQFSWTRLVSAFSAFGVFATERLLTRKPGCAGLWPASCGVQAVAASDADRPPRAPASGPHRAVCRQRLPQMLTGLPVHGPLARIVRCADKDNHLSHQHIIWDRIETRPYRSPQSSLRLHEGFKICSKWYGSCILPVDILTLNRGVT